MTGSDNCRISTHEVFCNALHHTVRLVGRASFTRGHTLVEESAFHWVPREAESCLEVLARGLMSSAPEFKLTEGRMVEGISGKAIVVRNGMNLLQSALRPITLRDGNRTVQCYYRRGPYRHQRIV